VDDDEIERIVGPAVDRFQEDWRASVKNGFSYLASSVAYPASDAADARLMADQVFDDLQLMPRERALLDVAAEFHAEHVEMERLANKLCTRCGATVIDGPAHARWHRDLEEMRGP
jgi:hypothetical protein